MKFGARLKYLRESNNLSQEELRKILKVSRSNISKYENGTLEPNLDFINRVSEYFNVTSDYLLGKADNPNKITLDKQPSLDYIKVAKKAESYGVPAKSLEDFIELVKNSVVVKE
jgi:transcriptional regulator with XRE-family HTH domain